MGSRITAALIWALVSLLCWALPAAGRHRKPSAAIRNAVTCENVNDRVRMVATPNPEFTASRVRPYWTARERALRWKRRRILVMAAHFRLDLDTRDIHAVPVVSGVR